MSYKSLYKLYHEDSDLYRTEYITRFNNPFSRHFSLTIKQFNHTKENEIFYCYTEEIASLQDNIMFNFISFNKLLEKIPGAGITQFLYTCLVEEIKSSNDIEGVHSTRKEITAALYSTHEKIRLSGIVNKYKKIITKEDVPLNDSKDIRILFDNFLADEIKRDDPDNLPDGQIFRTGSVNVVSETQKVIHRGVYPETKIITYMDSALNILHDAKIPIFIRIAIFHYLFGYIHPFYDGNGRMSRFITSYLLAQCLHPTIAMQVSILIKKNRKLYYDLFKQADSEINKGDLTPFIIGTLNFIYEAIIYTQKVLQKKLDQYQEYQDKLLTLNISDTTTMKVYNILLQATIFSKWGTTLDEIVASIDKSESTIYSRIRAIPKSYLIITKGSRPYHYRLNLSVFPSSKKT